MIDLRRWWHYQSMRYHRSRLPWREARRYTRHWARCRSEAPRESKRAASLAAAAALCDAGCARLTVEPCAFVAGGALEDSLHAFYGCEYAVYYGKTYHSESEPVRTGSQRWHADGGPGTCVIAMLYRTEVGLLDGPFEYVEWAPSLALYREEPADASRDALCDFYDDHCPAYHSVVGDARTAILFSNNVLHRGGFPHPGHRRVVSVYHCYPSRHRRDWSLGTPEKVGAYPKDPDI